MRTISVVLLIKDEKEASKIWDAHGKNSLLNGCFVIAIGNGDCNRQQELAEKYIDDDKFGDYEAELMESNRQDLGQNEVKNDPPCNCAHGAACDLHDKPQEQIEKTGEKDVSSKPSKRKSKGRSSK